MHVLTDLKPGMTLTVLGQPVRIRGSIWLEQEDFVWSEHLLEGGGPTLHWLSIEDDDGLIVTTWQARPDLIAEPGGRRMSLDGRRWKRYEKGTAHYMVEGQVDAPPAGRCEYQDYRQDAERLSFERFGDRSWEVSVGRKISVGQVRVEEGKR